MVNSKALVFIFTLCTTSLFGQSGYQGKDFWVAFPQNAQAETKSALKFTIYITSAKNTTGTITDKRTGKETYFQLKGYTPYLYEADTMSQIINNGISNYSFHITTEHDATVICYSARKASTDSYVAIPTHLLGTTYAVIGYDRLPTSKITFTTQFDVIAANDNTTLTINYPQGKAEALPPKMITLNKGEVYHQNSVDFIEYNYDLTGTIVTSNLPVAFLSGSSCAQVPQNKNFCDILLEMLPPSTATGKEFIIPAFAKINTSSLRVVAIFDDTKVTLNGNNIATLRAGQCYQNDSVQGTAVLQTSHRAYVVQYGQSATASELQIADPLMIVVSPTGAFARLIDFVVPDKIAVVSGGWHHFITLVSKTADITNITLDGKIVNTSDFLKIPNSAYSIAHIEISKGSHNISSTTEVGVYSYGYGVAGDNYDSYGHNCGMNLLVGGQ